MLRDCYYLKIKKLINYWQKTKRGTTIIFESCFKFKDRNFVYSAKYNQDHNKALHNWYNSLEFRLWEAAFGPCLHTGMMTWSKITAATGKASVKLHRSAAATSKLHLYRTQTAVLKPAAHLAPDTSTPVPPVGDARLPTWPHPLDHTCSIPDQHMLLWRSAEQTWPKLTATAKLLILHSKQGVNYSISKPSGIADSYCSSYYSVVRRDDYSSYLNAWMKMKAKLASAINQGALFKSKQMQLTEKLVRRQFLWHLQLQFWVTPSLYGYAKASWTWSSVLSTKSCLYSKHDKLLQYLWCKGSVPEV